LHAVIPRHQHGDAVTQFSLDGREQGKDQERRDRNRLRASLLRQGHDVTPEFSFLVKSLQCQVLVAHTCNPSYSGGRDQEAHGLKPAQANSS
jgi:hypothetical protein